MAARSRLLGGLGGLLAGLVLATTGGAAGVPGTRAALRPLITFSDGLLTARMVSTPLREVMEEVGRLTGAVVHWPTAAGDGDRVSVDFSGLPLDQAVARILRTNFVLSHGSVAGEPVTHVWVFREREAGASIRPATAGGFEADTAAATAPIHLPEQPPSRRLEAVGVLAAHAEEHLAARELLSGLAESDDDLLVREAARLALETGRGSGRGR